MFTWHDVPDEKQERNEFFALLDAQDRMELCDDILKRMLAHQEDLDFHELTEEQRTTKERIYQKMKHARWAIQDLDR